MIRISEEKYENANQNESPFTSQNTKILQSSRHNSNTDQNTQAILKQLPSIHSQIDLFTYIKFGNVRVHRLGTKLQFNTIPQPAQDLHIVE